MDNLKNKNNNIYLGKIVLTFILVIGLGLVVNISNQKSVVEGVTDINRGIYEIIDPKLVEIDGPFIETNNADILAGITAKSYLVYDLFSDKYLIGKNINKQLSVASLTKLTTALAVANKLSPDDIVTVKSEWINGSVNPSLRLVPGEKILTSSLLEGMLVASANDAALVLGYAAGEGDINQTIIEMNKIAKNLKAGRTSFGNTTGFDDPESFSTASDVLIIAKEVYRNPWLKSILGKSNGVVRSIDKVYQHSYNTTNSLLKINDFVVGGKTGYTDEARGNLVIIAKNNIGGEMLAVVLGSENREADMLKILNWVQESYNW